VETPSAMPYPGNIVYARIARHRMRTRVREDTQPGDPALPSHSHASAADRAILLMVVCAQPGRRACCAARRLPSGLFLAGEVSVW
jgi:hypothetical protein